MFCIKCGAQFPDEANFCHACGSRVFRSSEVIAAATVSADALVLKRTGLDEYPNIQNENRRQCPSCQEWISSDTMTCQCGYSFRTEKSFSFSKILRKYHELTSLKFERREQALKAMRECAVSCYFVGGIATIASLLLFSLDEHSLLVEVVLIGILYLGLGLWLHKTNSKIAATALVALSALGIVNVMRGSFAGGRETNIIVTVIVFILALRAAVAAYKLPELVKRVHLGSTEG